MTRRLDQRPGSEETLLALYDAVVAAEELDLVGQADDERVSESFGGFNDESATDMLDSDEGIEADDTDRPSMSQAVGVVEHLLGGHPIN